MVVYVTCDKEKKKVSFKGRTIKDLLLEMKLNPEEYLASREGSLLSDDDKVKDKDRIELHVVVSGG